jgi:hypothetical protein
VRSRFHRATAPSLLRHFRDCVKGAPRELYANLLLTAGPADKDSLVVIQMCYVGPKERGLEYLQALSSWSGESCLLKEVHEKTLLTQQDSVAQVLRGKRGNQWFIRSALISSLPDEVISKTVLEFADTPVGCSKSTSPCLQYFTSEIPCGYLRAFFQRGSLNFRAAPSPIMKGRAFQRRSAGPHSPSPPCTSGKWVSTTRAAFLAPKTYDLLHFFVSPAEYDTISPSLSTYDTVVSRNDQIGGVRRRLPLGRTVLHGAK